mmetsp:Transcript_80356/g.167350  ORF Transcript_80356/g.167350 Transcript_80356/m.167350 type:complete len:727 (+) Transcript_80356:113-2293(+)
MVVTPVAAACAEDVDVVSDLDVAEERPTNAGPVLLGRTEEGGKPAVGKGEELASPVKPLDGCSGGCGAVNSTASSTCLCSEDSQESSEPGLSRAGTFLSRAGTSLQRAGSNIQLQRASTLPTEDRELRHAATMPVMFDVESDRFCCCGLWKVQQFIGCLLGVGLALFFIISEPLDGFPAASRMLGVTALISCFWIFEVIPVYMTALLPIALLPFLNISTSEFVAQSYWNWISLLVVGTYLMDIALEEVKLPRRVVLQVLRKFGTVRPGLLLASFMVLAWALALFCNTIAVALLLSPFVINLMNAAQEQALNIAATESLESGDQNDNLASEQASREVERLAHGLLLGVTFGGAIGGLATLTGNIGNYFLAGESLVSSHITWANWFFFAAPISFICVFLAYGILWLRYVRSCRVNGVDKEVLEEEFAHFEAIAGPISRDEIIVGCLQLLQVALFMCGPLLRKVFTTKYGENLVNDATWACAPALMLFLIPSSRRPGQALLTWPSVHQNFDFGLLLLIGGSLAISQGFSDSGLSVLLGNSAANIVKHLPPFVLELVIMIIVSLAAQIFSCIGVAAAVLPVLESAALSAVVNPLSLMLPATVATSFVFILPTASPCNIIVLAKSQELSQSLRLRDFIKSGVPLSVITMVIAPALVCLMGMLVFETGSPFPPWACEAAGAGCVWAPIPGIVQGHHVSSQACVVQLNLGGNVCQLWNRTMVDATPFVPGGPL